MIENISMNKIKTDTVYTPDKDLTIENDRFAKVLNKKL